MAVIAAFELHDFVATRKSTRETNRTHRRFCARTHHAYQLDRWHQLAHLPRESSFDFSRRAERQAHCRAFLDSANDFRICMAENHRSPGPYVVDELAAVLRVD